MNIDNIEQLNTIHVDILRELGNIGSGNAVTSLSAMLGENISINVPDVKILGFNEAVDFVGGAENIVMGVLIKLESDINGMIMYIFNSDFVKDVIKIFFGEEVDNLLSISEMHKSALCEIGNIMGGAYVNALSSMTGLSINISTPAACVDMAGAILSVPSIEFAKVGDAVLFIDDSFCIAGHEELIKSNMILVPEMDSLNLLFERLGVC